MTCRAGGTIPTVGAEVDARQSTIEPGSNLPIARGLNR